MIPLHYVLSFYLISLFPFTLYNLLQKEKKKYLQLIIAILTAIIAGIVIIWNGCFRETPMMIDKIFFSVFILVALLHAVGNLISKRTWGNWLYLIINLTILIISFFLQN